MPKRKNNPKIKKSENKKIPKRKSVKKIKKIELQMIPEKTPIIYLGVNDINKCNF